MRCDEIRDELSAYIDEELPADERAGIAEHLDGCEECRAELEALRRTVAAVADLEPVSAPSNLLSSIRSEIADAGDDGTPVIAPGPGAGASPAPVPTPPTPGEEPGPAGEAGPSRPIPFWAYLGRALAAAAAVVLMVWIGAALQDRRSDSVARAPETEVGQELERDHGATLDRQPAARTNEAREDGFGARSEAPASASSEHAETPPDEEQSRGYADRRNSRMATDAEASEAGEQPAPASEASRVEQARALALVEEDLGRLRARRESLHRDARVRDDVGGRAGEPRRESEEQLEQASVEAAPGVLTLTITGEDPPAAAGRVAEILRGPGEGHAVGWSVDAADLGLLELDWEEAGEAERPAPGTWVVGDLPHDRLERALRELPADLRLVDHALLEEPPPGTYPVTRLYLADLLSRDPEFEDRLVYRREAGREAPEDEPVADLLAGGPRSAENDLADAPDPDDAPAAGGAGGGTSDESPPPGAPAEGSGTAEPGPPAEPAPEETEAEEREADAADGTTPETTTLFGALGARSPASRERRIRFARAIDRLRAEGGRLDPAPGWVRVYVRVVPPEDATRPSADEDR